VSDRRSRWAPLTGFVLVSSANQMAWLTFSPVATGAAQHYRVSTSTIGVLSEVFPLIYVLGAMPAARALDRSLRGWLAVGAVLSAAGTVVRLAGTGRAGFAWVLGGQVLVAAAQPFLLNAVVALARRYLGPEDRPTGIAIGSAGTFLGFVLAFVTGGVLGANHLAGLLVIGAVYAGLAAAAMVLALARTPCVFGDEVDARPAGLAEVRRLWADPVMRRLVYLVFVGFGVFVALVTWVQPLLQPAGVSTSTTDLLLTVMVLAGVASSAVLPPVVARHGRQLAALVVGGVATVVGCLVLAVAPGVPGAAVALVLTGLLLLPGMPVMLEVAERSSVAGAAAGAGFLWLAGQAGGIVVAGLVDAVQGTPWLAFTVLAVVILLAVPTAVRLRGRLAAAAASSTATLVSGAELATDPSAAGPG
jgi:predicted MFS family arabinose efflux permease